MHPRHQQRHRWNAIRGRRVGSARGPARSKGISLLEVVLALAILAMSGAILAQVASNATDNGLMAHRLATAQILAESKMAEVVTGAITIQGSSGWLPITDPVPNGTWYYSIQTVNAVRPNMIGIRLSITDADGQANNKELFYIVRWMIDPNLGLDTLPSSTSSTGSTSTGSTGSSAGTGSTSSGGIQ